MPSAPRKTTYVWSGKTKSSVYKLARRASGSTVYRPSAAKALAHNSHAQHYAKYDGKLHVMDIRRNGSPYWRALPPGSRVPGRARVR